MIVFIFVLFGLSFGQQQCFYKYLWDFDNCVYVGSKRREINGVECEINYECPNVGVNPGNLTFEVEYSDGEYMDEGWIEDPYYEIAGDDPDEITVSMWIDPVNHARFTLFGVQFTMKTIHPGAIGSMEIDDGILPAHLECHRCFDDSPGVHHFVFVLYLKEPTFINIYMDGKIIFSHFELQFDLTSTQIVFIDDYSVEEKFYKFEIIKGAINYDGAINLYEEGYGQPSPIFVCQNYTECKNYTNDLSNGAEECYEILENIYYIVNITDINVQLILDLLQECNHCELLQELINMQNWENITQLIVSSNQQTINLLVVGFTYVVDLLDILIEREEYNSTILINLMNQIIISIDNELINCNNTEIILNVIEENFEQVINILNVLISNEEYNSTILTNFFLQIISKIDFYGNNTEQILINIEENFEHIISLINIIISHGDECNCTQILQKLENILVKIDVNQLEVLDILDENFVDILNILNVLLSREEYNSTILTNFFLQIISKVDTYCGNNTEIILNLLEENFEQIIDILNILVNREEYNSTILTNFFLQIISQIDYYGNHTENILIAIEENFEQLLEILTILISKEEYNTTIITNFFLQIISKIDFYGNNTEQILIIMEENFEQIISLINIVIEKSHGEECNCTYILEMLGNIIEQIDVNHVEVISILNENFETIIDLLIKINESDIEVSITEVLWFVSENWENILIIIENQENIFGLLNKTSIEFFDLLEIVNNINNTVNNIYVKQDECCCDDDDDDSEENCEEWIYCCEDCRIQNRCGLGEMWMGDECVDITCYGLSYMDENVCTGHGVCLSYNNCKCRFGWIGDQCETVDPC